MDIIAKRVALQQQQFQEFQKRERSKKAIRIRQMFSYLSNEEINEALDESKEDEQAVILNFTQLNYLHGIRKRIAQKFSTSGHGFLNFFFKII
jgi:hypothetical protein